MPVGSEWWGAKLESEKMIESLGSSPMPVGSEWWGARIHFNERFQRNDGVANACRQ